MRLQNKVAVITGAASGFGAGTARLFATEGAAVVVADISDEAGESVADSINTSGGRPCMSMLMSPPGTILEA